MTWLEDRFRRKFEPHGEKYLFRQVDREVLFDREEVELLVANWRRYWLSPLLWGALLLVGLALPVFAWFALPRGFESAMIVSLLTIIACLVSLGMAQREPDEAAFMRDSVGPGRGRTPTWKYDAYWIGLALLNLGIFRTDRFLGDWPFWCWGMVLAFFSGRLILRLWKQYQRATRIA